MVGELAEQFARVEHHEFRAHAGVRELVPGDVLRGGTWDGDAGVQAMDGRGGGGWRSWSVRSNCDKLREHCRKE